MFQILAAAGFTTSPWKNGGGVTHEIASVAGPKGWVWRLSIAEVASDGPFSRFEGLSRVLTVIQGAGLDLHLPDGILPARPLQPVAFSGDTPLESRMVAGPIRDFNLIYDTDLIRAGVSLVTGPAQVPCDGGLLNLQGAIRVDDLALPQGDFALGAGLAVLEPGAQALVVSLSQGSH